MGAKTRSSPPSNDGERDLSHADQAYSKLREATQPGEFHLDQRLLADRFKISCAPVREAVRWLAIQAWQADKPEALARRHIEKADTNSNDV